MSQVDVDTAALPRDEPVVRPSALRAAANAAKRDALRGGLPAMIAMVLNVLLLMWLRTAMNYQHRHGGTSILDAIRILYAQGGIPRFYVGLQFAMVQAVLARFGDAAANAGILRFLEEASPVTKALPMLLKTAMASTAAALWRIAITPVDTLKTVVQVDGWAAGMAILSHNFAENGPTALFRGAVASSLATMAGHYPWFLMYNVLSQRLPVPKKMVLKLARSALIGWMASITSDCVSNPLRVLKTMKQTMPGDPSYADVLAKLAEDENSVVLALLFRGLGVKLVANAVQGLLFVVLWRLMIDWWDRRSLSKQRQKVL
jgi:hypothetical protein